MMAHCPCDRDSCSAIVPTLTCPESAGLNQQAVFWHDRGAFCKGEDAKTAENSLGKACLVINVVNITGEGDCLL